MVFVVFTIILIFTLRMFSQEQYFDSQGLFITVVYSGPILFNCFVMTVSNKIIFVLSLILSLLCERGHGFFTKDTLTYGFTRPWPLLVVSVHVSRNQVLWTTNPRGGTPDFKWRGWLKDFFGFEIFDSWIFLGMKIWQVFFWVAWFKFGFFWVFKMIWRFMVVPVYPGRVVLQIKYNQTCSCPGGLVLFRVVIHNVLGCPYSVVRMTTR